MEGGNPYYTAKKPHKYAQNTNDLIAEYRTGNHQYCEYRLLADILI